MPNFFPESFPLPGPDRDTVGFWEAAKQHRLVVQRCSRCGTHRMSPTPCCYVCQSFDFGWVESQGVGEVYSYIIVHHPIHPAMRDIVPFNIVTVELKDCGGVKLVSNLVECKNEDIHVGMPVEVAWEDTTPEVTQPRFRPLRK